MSDYKPVKGDRVRVVLEGEVISMGHGSLTIEDRELRGEDPGFWCTTTIAADAKFIVSIEKIEPPMEVFKPGDVVRGKHSGRLFALGDYGAVRLNGDAPGSQSTRAAHEFTSAYYEKVSLG